MEAILAGFVVGYALSVLALGILALRLSAHPGLIRSLQRQTAAASPIPFLAVAASLGLQVLFGVVGVAFGAAYWAVRSDAVVGLGSPSWRYTLAVLVFAGLSGATAAAFQPAWWRGAALMTLFFAGLFGWLLPHLAEA